MNELIDGWIDLFVCLAQDEPADRTDCPFSGGFTFRAYRSHRKMVNTIILIFLSAAPKTYDTAVWVHSSVTMNYNAGISKLPKHDIGENLHVTVYERRCILRKFVRFRHFSLHRMHEPLRMAIRSVVWLSVCLCVLVTSHDCKPRKNDWTVWAGPRNQVLYVGICRRHLVNTTKQSVLGCDAGCRYHDCIATC